MGGPSGWDEDGPGSRWRRGDGKEAVVVDWAAWTTVGIFSGSGGVLTDEMGAITGELSVHTTWAGGQADITVQYVGAGDWFTLAGSPVPAADEDTARDLHQSAVEAVKRGGGAQAPQP